VRDMIRHLQHQAIGSRSAVAKDTLA
jgi:hypothetical protein